MNIETALTIEGFMSESELTWLAERVKTCRSVIEIGSWMGRSSRAIADNMKAGGALYCIDTWEGQTHYYSQLTVKKIGGPNALYQIFKTNMQPHIKDGRVVPLRATSAEAHPRLVKFGVKADLVFIDGLHTYPAVTQDIALYRQLVKPGGILCGHDTNKRSVVHAVEDAFGLKYNMQTKKQKPKHWEEVHNHKSTEKIWWVQF